MDSSSPSSQIHPESEMIGLPTIAVIIIGLYLLSSIKILAEYERGVIFRLWSTLSMILVSFGPAASVAAATSFRRE